MAAKEGHAPPLSKFTFDMPHALVTLTDLEGNVEIEVWPKAGQSAYVVVPPPIARLIADRMLLMADAAEQEAPAADDPQPTKPKGTGDNVVDLASRRKRSPTARDPA
jgi:hypothetical protein